MNSKFQIYFSLHNFLFGDKEVVNLKLMRHVVLVFPPSFINIMTFVLNLFELYHSRCNNGGVEEERAPRMTGIEDRSPIAIDLSRINR